MDKMKGKYDDIIHLPHHTSTTRPRMPMADRAAQFSAFQALSGYSEAVKETERLTDRRIELDEYEKARLDHTLQTLLESGKQPKVTITYFQPDERKSGGRYVSVTGTIRKTDYYDRTILLEDKTKIPMDEVYEIEIH